MQRVERKKPTFEELTQTLKEKNINLSHQRLKVLEHLIFKEEHPTADQIYRDLHEEMATLSKTTVYNTLNLFVEAGVIRVVTIENNETRYDIFTPCHGHFKCEVCRRIHNFEIDLDSMVFSGLNHFYISQRDVYFKGICPVCLSNINKNNTKED